MEQAGRRGGQTDGMMGRKKLRRVEANEERGSRSEQWDSAGYFSTHNRSHSDRAVEPCSTEGRTHGQQDEVVCLPAHHNRQLEEKKTQRAKRNEQTGLEGGGLDQQLPHSNYVSSVSTNNAAHFTNQ